MNDSSKKFKILAHPNGTHTLVDPENTQSMHSRIGPELESLFVYAGPAEIEKLLLRPSSHIVLYDIGMGTGANTLAVLKRIQEHRESRGQLTVISFEEKPEGLATALENLTHFPNLKPWAPLLEILLTKNQASFRVNDVEIDWQLFRGDFYASLGGVPEPDVLFFDFYSPKVVPDLWSLEHFIQIRKKMGKHPARLFTYSASTPVRLHLLAAGFFVGKSAPTEIKNETTIASNEIRLIKNPLTIQWLSKLETSASIRGREYEFARNAARENPQWK